MLTVKMDATEHYDEETNTFIYTDPYELHMEHSLSSISKWEQKFERPCPLINNETMTDMEEKIYYLQCMCLDEFDDDEQMMNVLSSLKTSDIERIYEYINKKMTATTFFDFQSNNINRVTDNSKNTSELIYYAMIVFNIPFECERWHLNRLLTLIEVCKRKNQKQEGPSQEQLMIMRKEENRRRREAMKSRG